MVTIALTGGIGSGKTTIAKRLAELGGLILDADVFAREAVAVGSPALRQISARFGEDLTQADGTLDRQALGALVFGDDEARSALNDIVHPEVRRITGEKQDRGGPDRGRKNADARRMRQSLCRKIDIRRKGSMR